MKIFFSAFTSLAMALSLAPFTLSQGVDEACLSGDWAIQFTACLLDNACVCSNCEDLEDPDIDAVIASNGGASLTCNQINELWCPWVRCCSDCWESRQTYLQCTVVGIFSGVSILEENCQLDCGGFPANDVVDQDCEDGCGSEWGEYLSCTIDNCDDTATANCEAENDQQVTQSSLLVALGLSNSCGGVVNDILCPETSCCPACQGALANFAQCTINLDDTSPNCDVACATSGGNSGGGGSGGDDDDDDGNSGGGDDDDDDDAAALKSFILIPLAIAAAVAGIF